MAVIRSDLAGVIHAPLDTASTVVLRAGDTVPEGAWVHESRLEGAVEKMAEDDVAGGSVPAGNASSAAWEEFLESQGVEVPAGSTRSQMIALWESSD